MLLSPIRHLHIFRSQNASCLQLPQPPPPPSPTVVEAKLKPALIQNVEGRANEVYYWRSVKIGVFDERQWLTKKNLTMSFVPSLNTTFFSTQWLLYYKPLNSEYMRHFA